VSNPGYDRLWRPMAAKQGCACIDDRKPCPYHEGFAHAAEKAEAEIERLRALIVKGADLLSDARCDLHDPALKRSWAAQRREFRRSAGGGDDE